MEAAYPDCQFYGKIVVVWFLLLNEAHLKRLLTEFLSYHHGSRAHQSLECNAPESREVEPPDKGEVISIPVLGGLHHRYTRRAA